MGLTHVCVPVDYVEPDTTRSRTKIDSNHRMSISMGMVSKRLPWTRFCPHVLKNLSRDGIFLKFCPGLVTHVKLESAVIRERQRHRATLLLWEFKSCFRHIYNRYQPSTMCLCSKFLLAKGGWSPLLLYRTFGSSGKWSAGAHKYHAVITHESIRPWLIKYHLPRPNSHLKKPPCKISFGSIGPIDRFPHTTSHQMSTYNRYKQSHKYSIENSRQFHTTYPRPLENYGNSPTESWQLLRLKLLPIILRSYLSGLEPKKTTKT